MEKMEKITKNSYEKSTQINSKQLFLIGVSIIITIFLMNLVSAAVAEEYFYDAPVNISSVWNNPWRAMTFTVGSIGTGTFNMSQITLWLNDSSSTGFSVIITNTTGGKPNYANGIKWNGLYKFLE